MIVWLNILFFIMAAVVGILMAFTTQLDDDSTTTYKVVSYGLIGAGLVLSILQFMMRN